MSDEPSADDGTEIEGWAAYRCPRTGLPLHLDGKYLKTRGDEHAYEIRDGIPCFLQFQSIDEGWSEDELSELTRICAERDWRSAVIEVYGADSEMLRYVDSTSRELFLDLLPLTDESTVLEIGIGFGQFTIPLARRAARVHALEVRFQQAVFADLRRRQEGLSNVEIACGGDDCRLPYPDASMDIVVMNLVFEWCASRRLDEAGCSGQELLLREVMRVLKPGGTMYLSTKNRYALRILLGGNDEHAHDMAFGHALPAPLMNYLLKRRGYNEPSGTIHSYRTLERMIRSAGYSELRSFWALPEMRFPDAYIPTDAVSVRKARHDRKGHLTEIRRAGMALPLIPSGLVKHFTPGLVFLARKQA